MKAKGLPVEEGGGEVPSLAAAGSRGGGALDYRPQIDTLRALAVLPVLVHHFLKLETPGVRWIPEGFWGVRLFFVISGFLITGILLRERELIAAGVWTPGAAARRFYMRRFLRIVPVYYAVLLAAWVLDISNVRDSIGWHVTYLSNFWVEKHGWVVPSHLWSLAVEEQFYLLWPAVILCLPRRWLMPICLGALVVAPVFRQGMAHFVKPLAWHISLMPGCLDFLAAGALLAIWRVTRDAVTTGLRTWWITRGGLAGLAVLAAACVYPPQGVVLEHLAAVLLPAAFYVVCVWGVDRCAHGVGGPLGWFLSFPPLMYLGRISYGIYLMHAFVPKVLERVYPQIAWGMPDDSWAHFAVKAGCTVAVAAVSWQLFEKPINKLKRFFPYRPTRRAGEEVVTEGVRV
jgi:peptidoglycan/LPS O-acetylase OafA/YrhL